MPSILTISVPPVGSCIRKSYGVYGGIEKSPRKLVVVRSLYRFRDRSNANPPTFTNFFEDLGALHTDSGAGRGNEIVREFRGLPGGLGYRPR